MPIYIGNTNQCQAKMSLLLPETGMKKAHKIEFFCSKHVKTKNLWCQVEVTSSCPVLVFVSQTLKRAKTKNLWCWV
jgi:hypothetical protein